MHQHPQFHLFFVESYHKCWPSGEIKRKRLFGRSRNNLSAVAAAVAFYKPLKTSASLLIFPKNTFSRVSPTRRAL